MLFGDFEKRQKLENENLQSLYLIPAALPLGSSRQSTAGEVIFGIIQFR
jgi:hypothetical protein